MIQDTTDTIKPKPYQQSPEEARAYTDHVINTNLPLIANALERIAVYMEELTLHITKRL